MPHWQPQQSALSGSPGLSWLGQPPQRLHFWAKNGTTRAGSAQSQRHYAARSFMPSPPTPPQAVDLVANRPDPLERFVSADRIARIDHVLAHRLQSVAVACEDVFDPHNVAACVRTCEGLGLMDLHWILNRNALRLTSTVAKSADQWMDFYTHQGTPAAIAALKAQGCQVWVSDLQATQTLDDLELPAKVVVVVGNAKFGISEAMRSAADQRYILPMRGMVQSFNLSVALALTLANLVPRRRRELALDGQSGDLSPDRLARIRRKWLEFGVDRADIVRRVLDAEADGSGTGQP